MRFLRVLPACLFLLLNTLSFSQKVAAVPPDICGETLFYSESHESGSAWTSPTNYNGPADYELAWEYGSGISYSGTQRWYIHNYGVTTEARLESPAISIPLTATNDLFLRFYHAYDTDLGDDGGVVEVNVNNSGFTDVGVSNFTQNGYPRLFNGNGTVLGIREAFTGTNSSFPGYMESIVDLSALAEPGDTLAIRFHFASDDSEAKDGWYIDDVQLGYCASVNTPPVASDLAISTNEDTSVNDTVTATDDDGDSLLFSVDTQPTNGNIVLNPDGSFTYTPNGNYNGSDSFVVLVDDQNGGTDTATVNVTVIGVNDNPVLDAGGDQTTDVNTMVTVDFTYSDPDVGDTHTGMINWGDGSGTQPASLNSGLGSSNHVYASGGTFTVTVTVTDSSGGVGVDTLVITVYEPTPTPTPTETSTSTPTDTPTATNTSTPTDTPTATNTSTPTDTPTPTNTTEPSSTATFTPTETNTSIPTDTPTATNTSTPTDTPTATNTSTPTNTPTNTLEASSTATSTFTPTASPSATNSSTLEASPTSTSTVTPTETPITSALTITPDAPPPAPDAYDANADPDSIVRMSVPDYLINDVNVREIVVNGAYPDWMGNDMTNAGFIGIQGVLNMGVRQAVDIFSPTGLSYFEGGIIVCLRGEGTLVYLNSNHAPRSAEIVGSYTVPDFPGFTCVTLFESGTLVLVDPV